MKKFLLLLSIILISYPAHAADSLKLGLLLIEDSVPFYVAEQENYYTRENLQVELIPFLSALERDSALVAGAIDGAIADPVGAILFDKGRGQIKITSLCLGETPDEGVFAIMASPKSGLKNINDLKNVEIAVSSSTIIEYVTDRLLEGQGFRQEDVKKIEVKKMPIRMQMLLSDSVKAATLPEPLASIAEGKGAKKLITDASAEKSLSQTVIVFRADVLKEKKSEVKKFFKAYADAVTTINNDPEKYRNIFVEKGRIPPFLAKNYPIPTYPPPAPFGKSLYQPIIEWLVAKKLVARLPYETMVVTDFIGGQN